MKLAQLRSGQRVALLEVTRPQASYDTLAGQLTFGLTNAEGPVEAEVRELRVSGTDPVTRAQVASGVRVRTQDGTEHVTHPRYCVGTWDEHQTRVDVQQAERESRFGLAQRTAAAIGATLTVGIRPRSIGEVLLTLDGFTRAEIPALMAVLQPTWDEATRARRIALVEHLEAGRHLTWPTVPHNLRYKYRNGAASVLEQTAADLLQAPGKPEHSYQNRTWEIVALGGPCVVRTSDTKLMVGVIAALAEHRGIDVDVDDVDGLTQKVIGGQRDLDTVTRWRAAVADRLADSYLSENVIGVSLRSADTWEGFTPVVDVQLMGHTVATASLVLDGAARWELTHDGLLGDAGTETLLTVDGPPTIGNWNELMAVPAKLLIARVRAVFISE